MVSDRIPQSPPIIKPIADEAGRPLWSVMIPTYNCSNYLKQTLQSVLIQARNPEEMQIVVVDDCSTDDDVEAIVDDIGNGRIGFFRQTQNVGSLRNFETCINMATGKLIHILHGDDVIKPGFYSEVEDLFIKFPSVGAAFTSLSIIDERGDLISDFRQVQNYTGIVDNWLLKIASKQFAQVCAVVVKRAVYEELGSFYAVHYGEDWEMWARIASKYPVAFSIKNLALYREHNDNISARSLSTNQNIKDLKKVFKIIENYVPQNKRKEIKKIASHNSANYFAQNAFKIYSVYGNKSIALKQARGALLLHFNKCTLKTLLMIYVMIFKNYFKRLTDFRFYLKQGQS
ncbi:MAG TPA: glycosyltransferase [Mucilaginibacter sp.]|jgi:glycosyltransferase involved in cell wall biosynthesis